MSDVIDSEGQQVAETFDLEIFNVSGEVSHTEIEFDQNYNILEVGVIDGNRRC